jgi:RXT2-like, N-terminal
MDVAETIAALKRALKREKDSKQAPVLLQIEIGKFLANVSPHPAPSTQPILAASNRGNKLKQGARYVHEGALAFMQGPDVYKHVRWITWFY